MVKQSYVNTFAYAKVCAAQGYFEKAYEICQNLLQLEPGRQEIIDFLNEIQVRLIENSVNDSEDLVNLFVKWISLMVCYNSLQKLKEFSILSS